MSEVTELINKFWETHQERETTHISFQEKIGDIFEKSNMNIGMVTISNESSFEIFYPVNIINQGDLKKLNDMFEDYILAYIESVKNDDSFKLVYYEKNKQVKHMWVD